MGNLITNEKAGDDEFLQLSNGSTDVLLSVLLLSGSDLARTPWEVELVTWLAEHDQSVFGSGVVGFDLDDFAWSRDCFDAQRDFLLRMIELALQRHRWETLSYDPPLVAGHLARMKELVLAYRAEFVEVDKPWEWWSAPRRFDKCAKHAVYVHNHGCLLCHDGQ